MTACVRQVKVAEPCDLREHPSKQGANAVGISLHEPADLPSPPSGLTGAVGAHPLVIEPQALTCRFQIPCRGPLR